MSMLMGRVFLFSDSLQHKMSVKSLFIANKRVINLQTQFHDEILRFIDFKNRACKAVCSPARSLGGRSKDSTVTHFRTVSPLGCKKKNTGPLLTYGCIRRFYINSVLKRFLFVEWDKVSGCGLDLTLQADRSSEEICELI